MEHMWSPWRSRHLDGIKRGEKDVEQEETSLFARLAAQDRDAENFILWRGERVFVLMNLYPYNNGHLMIVPFRQVAQYEALTPEEQIEIARTIERCIRWLRRALSPHGFNVGINLGAAAGAGLPDHLHVHVVPRWSGDTNFMPAVGEVKVIPEAMEETYRKLRTAVEDDAAVAEKAPEA